MLFSTRHRRVLKEERAMARTGIRVVGLLFFAFIIGLFLLPAATIPASPCPKVTIAGPWVFTREAGKPQTQEVFFSIPNLNNHFSLRIVNGDANGTHRVSSATITLNGTQIAGPSDFNQQVALR